jgi:hypothetical protein
VGDRFEAVFRRVQTFRSMGREADSIRWACQVLWWGFTGYQSHCQAALLFRSGAASFAPAAWPVGPRKNSGTKNIGWGRFRGSSAWAEDQRLVPAPFFPHPGGGWPLAQGGSPGGRPARGRARRHSDHRVIEPYCLIGTQKVDLSRLTQYQWVRRRLPAYSRVLERLREVWTLGTEPAGTA